jgi:Holliday junction resolvasome RuvABC endonuclease subunit
VTSPRVIGVDPSLTATGLALVDGSLTTVGGAAALGDGRLTRIHDEILRACDGGPVLAVLEDLPTHTKSAGITGMVQGVVRLALRTAGVPYVTVVPATLKKYATGRGGADKADMRMALYQRTGVDERDDNRVDAWWLRHAGLDWLGAPVIRLPKQQRDALVKVAWPPNLRAAAHLFVADTPDWGGRPLCRSCGGERGQHPEPGRG